MGWYIDKKDGGSIAGTYIHGIFENDDWRIGYLNFIRAQKGIHLLDNTKIPYKIKREAIIDKLAFHFKKHINISPLLN